MKHIVLASLLALGACTNVGAPGSPSSVTAVADQVRLKAVTALSLAELAYNSAEASATAALRSGHLSAGDAQNLGDAVHAARAYRNEARALVAAGQDASSTIESLGITIAAITRISAQSGGN